MENKRISSIAVWFDEFDEDKTTYPDGSGPFLHLDVNLWSTQNDSDSYLEVGFKVSNWINVEKIHCFLPFNLKDSVFDKSEYLRENQIVFEALLNKSINLISFSQDERFIEVQFPDNSSKPTLFLYTPQKNLKYSEGGNICVELPKKTREYASNNNDIVKSELYIRLRFKAPNLYPMVKKYKPWGRFFKGELEEISFVDFRINSYRSLPLGLKVKSKNTPISSMNFFLMTDEWNKIEIETNGMNASRLLESHVWTDYLADDNTAQQVKKKNSKAQIIAYHWSYPSNGLVDPKQHNKKGYNIFIKLYRSKSSIREFALTLALVLASGISASVFTSMFF